MDMIRTIEGLRTALSTDLVKTETELNDKFSLLAKSLFNNFQIMKGERFYWMTEVEFYLYHDGHRDIITYPRNCEAGMWFFHASGVDISFESKVEFKENERNHKLMPYLTKDAVFGGILLRGVVLAESNATPVSGPMKVCDELFDLFDAFAAPTNFPQIVEATVPRNVAFKKGFPEKRYGLNPNPAKKVQDILSYNYSDIDAEQLTKDELVKGYEDYLVAKYRFIASE